MRVAVLPIGWPLEPQATGLAVNDRLAAASPGGEVEGLGARLSQAVPQSEIVPPVPHSRQV
jgi:hypothetical protein